MPLAAYSYVVDAAPPQADLKFAFVLTPIDGGAERGIVLAAPTAEDRSDWVNAINAALGTERSLSLPKHKPRVGFVPETRRQLDEMMAVASIAERNSRKKGAEELAAEEAEKRAAERAEKRAAERVNCD